MLARERQIPLIILRLQALLRRLPRNHPKRAKIKEDLNKWMAGYRGEQSLDFYLIDLDTERFSILPNIRLLNHNKNAFQMDFLLLSPNYLLILEVKNISGTLYFEKHSNQVIRSINQIEQGFKNPITQVKRQKEELQNWLRAKKVINIPIETLVVFTNSSTILKTSPNNYGIFNSIIHAEQLLNRIHELDNIHQVKRLEKKEIRKLEKMIQKEDTVLQQDILNLYEISRNEITVGVGCPRCNTFHMIRERGIWRCPTCGKDSKDAHLEALEDFFLLLDSSISNKSCREFLKLSSRHSVKKLLAKASLQSSGSKKSTIYLSPYE